MRQAILKIIDKAARRASRTLAFRKVHDNFDVLEMAYLNAAFEAAEYYEQNLLTARPYDSDLDLLSRAIQIATQPGLLLEFGVASGRTISHIAAQAKSTIYGFDSFEGLPEAWRSGFDKGAFAGGLPLVSPNVQLIKGWFKDTLVDFLADHAEQVSLLHIDCDLYSSTKTIFDLLATRLTPGSVIVFDEYWNYPGWRQHEHKAFLEFLKVSGLTCHYDSFVPSHQQVCIVLTSPSAPA